jgi:hypothetical protein
MYYRKNVPISNFQAFSPAKVIFAGVGVLLLVRISLTLFTGHHNARALRRLGMFVRVKTL